MWTYTAYLDRLIDGDTFDVWIELRPQRVYEEVLPGQTYKVFDFGFSIYGPTDMAANPIMHHERVRLWGVNAPEIRGEEREEGKKALAALALYWAEHENEPVTVETVKEKGKYGRYVAKTRIGDVDVSTWMVENGYAQWKEY